MTPNYIYSEWQKQNWGIFSIFFYFLYRETLNTIDSMTNFSPYYKEFTDKHHNFKMSTIITNINLHISNVEFIMKTSQKLSKFLS